MNTKTKLNSSLLSPILDDKDRHVAFSASTDLNTNQHSTINAMAQGIYIYYNYIAAKYYNDLHEEDKQRSSMQTSTIYAAQTAFQDADQFECRQLEYGQNALFHQKIEQYFADISDNMKRHVLINIVVSRITELCIHITMTYIFSYHEII